MYLFDISYNCNVKYNMQKKTVKLLKKFSRAAVPVSSLKGKVISSKKKLLVEKAIIEEMSDAAGNKK